MGDFNIGDRQPNYQRLRAQLGDAFYGVGWGLGLSYPVNRLPLFPLVRIDYLFHSPQWQRQRIWQGQRTGSDHKYLVAELRRVGRSGQSGRAVQPESGGPIAEARSATNRLACCPATAEPAETL